MDKQTVEIIIGVLITYGIYYSIKRYLIFWKKYKYNMEFRKTDARLQKAFREALDIKDWEEMKRIHKEMDENLERYKEGK